MDRTEIMRAVAKVIAYKNCGKQDEAAEWGRKLIKLLDLEELIG